MGATAVRTIPARGKATTSKKKVGRLVFIGVVLNTSLLITWVGTCDGPMGCAKGKSDTIF
jgi:hypothetical protein